MLRILTYNTHRCVGSDRRADPARIADVIARYAPDIVALQELDVGRARTGRVDQAEVIARHLSMDVHFHPAVTVEEEAYGDAILTARPIRMVKAGLLPGLPHRPWRESRGALWVSINLENGTELQVINTHLGLLAAERMIQAESLLGGGWLGHPQCRGKPAVLLGDFNAVPRSRAYARLAGRLQDAQRGQPGHYRPRPTFPARWPVLRLDHVFLTEGMEVLDAIVPRGQTERVASDHLPVVVTVRLND
ncbi:MAG: endonuclease/exonuclease/phosphatase family protein [Gammaproteobacteria bacterium]